jgi:hypothetical protein
MALPWQMWPGPQVKPKRKFPGGLTGNALLTGIVCAIVAGVISYYVAHWQAQDAARQAIASQQTQQVIQLESDARTFIQLADRTYLIRGQCLYLITPACKQSQTTIIDNPFRGPELALGADAANVSDAAAKNDAYNLEYYALQALPEVGSGQGYTDWVKMGNAYSALLTRCGQLIQGQQLSP